MKITRKHFLRSLAGIAGAGFCFRRPAGRAVKSGALAMKDLGRTGCGSPPWAWEPRTLEPALIRAAIDQGIRFLDTGRSYMNGRNEEMIGRALQGKRQQVVIQSKIELPEGFPGTVGGKQVAAHLERKLAREPEGPADRLRWMSCSCMGSRRSRILDHETCGIFSSRPRRRERSAPADFPPIATMWRSWKRPCKRDFTTWWLLPFNPFGRFRHSIGGWPADWDQERLIEVMGRAHAAGIGIVAMKTCSARALCPAAGRRAVPGRSRALGDGQSLYRRRRPAIANFTQLEEHLSMHRA